MGPQLREFPSLWIFISDIKDTTDFLLKLKSVGKVPLGSLLVTLDVRSLYTNIPHAEGLEACRELLNTRVVQKPPTKDTIKLITLMMNIIYNSMEQQWEPVWLPRMQTF